MSKGLLQREKTLLFKKRGVLGSGRQIKKWRNQSATTKGKGRKESRGGQRRVPGHAKKALVLIKRGRKVRHGPIKRAVRKKKTRGEGNGKLRASKRVGSPPLKKGGSRAERKSDCGGDILVKVNWGKPQKRRPEKIGTFLWKGGARLRKNPPGW